MKRTLLILLGLSLLLIFSCSKLRTKEVRVVEEVTIVKPCVTAPDPEGRGYFLMCPEQDPVLIPNGQDGQDGKDGQEGQEGQAGQNGKDAQIELVTPCSDIPSNDAHPETFVCINGTTLFAVYDNGTKGQVRLVKLIEGVTYRTTDTRSCVFTVRPLCQLEY